jgi:hypothetical protein
MSSKPAKIPEPPKRDIAGDISGFISGYTGGLPSLLTAESQFRPEFQGLNLGDVSTFLGGVKGQEGIYGLTRQAAQESGQALGEARQQELGQMTGQSGLFRGFMQALSPEGAAAVRQSQMESDRAFTASQGVTPQEKRGYEQQAREAFQASGRLGGNAAIVSEAMGRENVLGAKRAEAAEARNKSFLLSNQFYQQPGLASLQGTPLSYQQGQNVLGLGLGAIGSGKPQMINPDVAIGLGDTDRMNAFNRNKAQAEANAAASAQNTQTAAAVASAIGMMMLSDKRMKKDIKEVGETKEGLPIYTFKYKGENKTQMGVMAQDVEKKKPKAVKVLNGIKMVDYSKIK